MPSDKLYFQFAYPAPAASSPDFPAFLLLQEIVSGGSGLNLRQTDWAPTTPAARGSFLFGATDDIATWLPPTRDPFLFIIGGSIAANADPAALERDAERRIGFVRDRPVSNTRLVEAKLAVRSALAEDVQTTEDAAHQLAFFAGLGALDALLDLPRSVAAVTPADVQRVARMYLAPDRLTVGWMVPGNPYAKPVGAAAPRPAADRAGAQPVSGGAGPPQLRRLSGGLPAIIRPNPLSDTVTVELLLSAPVEAGARPADLPGVDAIIRSGTPEELLSLIGEIASAPRKKAAPAPPPSDDPATRLEQLIVAQTAIHAGSAGAARRDRQRECRPASGARSARTAAWTDRDRQRWPTPPSASLRMA